MSYPIKFKQCGSDHMTYGRTMAVDHLLIHYSATKASAKNNAIYFSRNEGQGASAHLFVDDISEEIYQSVRFEDTAWHAGNWAMNCRSIGIEVVSAGEDFSKVEQEKLRWLVSTLMERYGIPASNVIRHYDVTGKICPAPYIEASKWAALKSYITGAAASAPSAKPSAPSGDVTEVALRVIALEYGNYPERKTKLEAEGYDYDEVQAEVNRILGVGGGSGNVKPSGGSVAVGSMVRLKTQYDYNGTHLAMPGTYRVGQLNGDRAVLYSGSVVMAACKVSNLTVVSGGSTGGSSSSKKSIAVGSKVRVINPVDEHGVHLAVSGTYDVMQVNGDRIVIGRGGVVTAAINRANLKVV